MSTDPLIVSVSGIRGIVGTTLTPRVVGDFAATYGTPRRGGEVVVSRDGRSTGELLKGAVVSSLLAVGCDVVEIGIASTPTCGFFTRERHAAGAIQITASHNPPEYNGLKLFRPEGFVLSPADGQKVADDYRDHRFTLVPWSSVGKVIQIADPFEAHLQRVLSLVDVEKIRARRFSVALDANHGSGGVFGPRLLRALGCLVTTFGETADGLFEHPPEPTEAHLADIALRMRQQPIDVGFATDPDADRLAIMAEGGLYIGEELTLALAIRHRVASEKGPVVINSSTSRVSEDVARAAGCPVFRSKVGEVHVAERMIRERAVIGGEGNGGVIDPRVVHGRDSAIAMALVLDLLASENRPLSALVDEMPRYAIKKDKHTIDRDRLPKLLTQLKDQFRDGELDESDGLRVDWPDAWVQVRASNTEPIIRVIAESQSAERAERLCQDIGALAQAI